MEQETNDDAWEPLSFDTRSPSRPPLMFAVSRINALLSELPKTKIGPAIIGVTRNEKSLPSPGFYFRAASATGGSSKRTAELYRHACYGTKTAALPMTRPYLSGINPLWHIRRAEDDHIVAMLEA